MQTAALNNIARLRAEGKNKALLISATGTGKTYLSARKATMRAQNFILWVRLLLSQSIA